MFANIVEKINWLSKNCSRAVSKEIHRVISQSVQESFAHNTIPSRVSDLMILDIMYCYLRNARWTNVTLFCEIFADYLICNFSLDRDCCEDLVLRLSSSLSPMLPLQELDPKTEKEFLRYLFLCTSIAKNGEEAFSHFGFGINIFKRIKQAVEITNDMTKEDLSTDEARFIADIDAALVEVIFEITEEYNVNPGIIDLHKLSFLVSDMSPDEKVLIHGIGLEKVLSLLVALGAKKSLSSQDIQRKLVLEKDQAKAVFTLLQRVDLIFMIEDSTNPAKARWSLSDLGLSIAAPAFAQEFWQTFDGSDWKAIFQLNGHYQEATIELMPQNLIPRALELTIEQIKGLAPKSLAALFTLIFQQGLTAIGEQLAIRIVTSEALSPWLRKEACDFLSQRSSCEEIRQILKNVAESDVSNSVKDAALLGLANGLHT